MLVVKVGDPMTIEREYVSPEDRPPGVRIVPAWLRELLITDESCIYCGLVRATVVDHVIPVCGGGTNDPSNLIGACERCNAEKADRTPAEWFADLGQSLERALLMRYIERPVAPSRRLLPTIQDQFERWFDTTDESTCWLWPRDQRVGCHPQTRKPVAPTRWAYKHYREDIGSDLYVPTRCNRAFNGCVNPWHRTAYKPSDKQRVS